MHKQALLSGRTEMADAQATQSARTGRYIRHPAGYQAFHPAALPPSPAINIDQTMQTLLLRADRALGRLDGSIQTLPNPNLFVFMYVRKEAVLSSQIEGTQSSIDDLLQAEARIFDADRPSDVDEVLNYVKAMNYGLDRLNELPFSIRLVREIHAQLLRGVRGRERQPGEIRDDQNWIGPPGCTRHEATFVPPPPTEVEGCLANLEYFVNSDTRMPLLVKIGLVHAQFETIHPFHDGNGRIGRLLIAFLLCRNNVLQKPVLYISHYFKRHRERYYDLLQRTRDSGDLESWLNFFLEGVTQVSDEATDTARRIVALREQHRVLITREFGRTAGNALSMLEHLFTKPIVQVNDVARILDISYPSANILTENMVQHGILQEITGRKRHRRFRYSPYVELFADA